ncbi:MAG: phosphatidylserine/phosphatidylglycerophosphate/cardiolipin synthase family protein [Bacteroidales bacterium]|nr:phosphatidylserine/phosphatidylglycerophosphate/cardiolipin synthase family protein [Bacteroidales bacterium]
MNDSPKYQLYDDPLSMFSSMIDDIMAAKHSIYLQTFKFANDDIGKRFRTAFIKKIKEGVKIKVLIDSWGTGVNKSFFCEIIDLGAEVKFFQKIKFSFDIFSRNHRRNHRKLLIIDNNISYIGSSNITTYCLNWRECTIRLTGGIATEFIKIIEEDFKMSNKVYQNKNISTQKISKDGINIIRDVPGTFKQHVRKAYIDAINSAKEEIIIETPYFLPASILRKSIYKAAERGVKIKIITPRHSDLMLFDILRNRYLGKYHQKNIAILLYMPDNLHAKVFLVDNKYFLTGSSNFDYRSMQFMHEINIDGKKKEIINLLKSHLKETIKDCKEFDYEVWKKRSRFLKVNEALLVPFRHLF